LTEELEQIKQILKNLVESTNILQVVIVDQNGLPISSYDRKSGKINDEMENKISALAASIYLLSEKTSGMFEQGMMQQMLIKNQKGKIIITNINDQSLIICILDSSSSADSVILLHLKNACNKLKSLEILNKKALLPNNTDFVIPSID